MKTDKPSVLERNPPKRKAPKKKESRDVVKFPTPSSWEKACSSSGKEKEIISKYLFQGDKENSRREKERK